MIQVNIVNEGRHKGRVFFSGNIDSNASISLVSQAFACSEEETRLLALRRVLQPDGNVANAYPDDNGSMHVYFAVDDVEHFACVVLLRPSEEQIVLHPFVEGPDVQVVEGPILDACSVAEALRQWAVRTQSQANLKCEVRIWADSAPPESAMDRYLVFLEKLPITPSSDTEAALSQLNELNALHRQLSESARIQVQRMQSKALGTLLHASAAAPTEEQGQQRDRPPRMRHEAA